MKPSFSYLIAILISFVCLNQCQCKLITVEIDKLTQLNQDAKRDSASIQALLYNLRKQRELIEQDSNSFFNAIDLNCYKTHTLSQSFITNLTDQIKANELYKALAGAEIEKSQLEQSKYAIDYNKTINEYEGIKERIQLMMEELKTRFIEANKKTECINTMKNIIHEEIIAQQKKQTSAQDILVIGYKQVTTTLTTTCVSSLTKFKTQLVQLTSLIKDPIIITLKNLLIPFGIEIDRIDCGCNCKWSDESSLRKIIELLSQLEDNVNQSKMRISIESKSSIKAIKAQGHEKQKQLRSLSNLIFQTKSKIKENIDYQDQLDAQITYLKSTLERKQIELSLFTELCEHQAMKRNETIAFYEQFQIQSDNATMENMKP